jgi:dinuclear metal center YbgI/SA1388 family protein
MTTISEVIHALEAIAPPYLQESYDNAGLIVGYPDRVVHGVLFSLDATEAVIEEAIAKGCNLVVSHHPIVFRGLKRFNGNNYVERAVMLAIRHEIALYAIHTNLDNVLYRGVNARIAAQLGLRDIRILAPKPGTPDIGAGIVGFLDVEISDRAFLQHLKQAMQAGCVRHTAWLDRPVQTIAVCGGAGSFLLPEARKAGADVFVTADYKYHEFFDAEGQILIADIGHYESEQYTIDLLHDLVQEKFSTFALHLTEVRTNPVFYL